MTVLADMRNPILWMEHIHQTRNAPSWARAVTIAGTVGCVLLIGLTAWVFEVTNGYPAMQIAIYTVWSLQALVAVRCIIAGANAISREHVGQTWDALVLTGIGTRQILYGKWRAALRRAAPWMLALGAVRIAMLPIFALGIVKVYASYWSQRSLYVSSRYPADWPEFQWIPWACALAVVAALALTVIETLCCTALGLAASAFTRRTINATVLAILIRFAPVIFFSIFVRYQLGETFFWRWWGRTEFSLSDTGTSAMMVLSLPDMPWTHDEQVAALPGLLLAALLISGLALLSLVVAWALIRRTGALPAAGNFPKSFSARLPLPLLDSSEK